MSDNFTGSRAMILQFKKELNELAGKASQAELSAQKFRNARNKIDDQLAIFTNIHKYSMMAFDVQSKDELLDIMVEGFVDIFQLEIGLVLKVNLFDNILTLSNSCNFESDIKTIEVSEQWFKEHSLWDFDNQKVGYESPVVDTFWKNLGLAYVVFMPFFDYERQLQKIVVGGITEAGKQFYDFTHKEILSPFMVFCQQMNGINNNYIAMEKVRQHADAKNSFLSNLSHEIRTPMNAIVGMVQLARKSNNKLDIEKYIRQIDISSTHLLGLLTDVLDIAKIEEGKFVLVDSEFDLKEISENIINTVRSSAQNKNQQLHLSFYGLNLSKFKGDAVKLAQVLINLLSNAIKFTPDKGKISLEISELSREDNRSFVDFRVADTGIGLTEDFLKRIFKPFEQADSGISRKYGGTGLGLTISQRIVEMMGGRIKVENIASGGSLFSFCVWFDVQENSLENTGKANGLQDIQPFDLKGKNVLVVDDIDINRAIAVAFLDELGAKSQEAENGKEAMDMFLQSAENHYDLILMDMQMPVMDGLTATKAIRNSQKSDAKDIVILAMTANVLAEDMQEAIAAGMNAYISKPIKYEVFAATIQNAMSRQEEMLNARTELIDIKLNA